MGLNPLTFRQTSLITCLDIATALLTPSLHLVQDQPKDQSPPLLLIDVDAVPEFSKEPVPRWSDVWMLNTE